MLSDSEEDFDLLDANDESLKLLLPQQANSFLQPTKNGTQFRVKSRTTTTSSSTAVIPHHDETQFNYYLSASPTSLSVRRSNRRFTAWAIFTIILFLLVMVYIPLSNNFRETSRIGR